MYKIFFKDRVLYLTNQIDRALTPDFGAIHKLGSEGELKKFIQDFEKNKDHQKAYIYHHDEEELFRRFSQHYTKVPAAGGLVWNNSRTRFLMIFRQGRPDLPKGKTEAGESFEKAAVREVAEECGIEFAELLSSLGPTFHTYQLKGLPILKETRWFEMIYHGQATPNPQVDENITEAKWIRPQDAESIITNTYPSIREVLMKATIL